MNERLSSRELKQRTNELRSHLWDLDWYFLKHTSSFHPIDFQGAISVIFGVKPVFILGAQSGKDDYSKLIPPPLKDRVIVTERGYVVDIPHLAKTIKHYQKYYPDFDQDLLSDNEYVLNYLNLRTTDTGKTSDNEIIKMGLILGYPLDSVLAFTKRKLKRGREFNCFGYNFSACDSDVVSFHRRLHRYYHDSGMLHVLMELQLYLANEFIDSLPQTPGSMAVVTIEGRNYLELIDTDTTENHLIHELLPLFSPDCASDLHVDFVQDFGSRYDIPTLKHRVGPDGREISVGNYFDLYVDFCHEVTRTGNIPYFRLVETVDSYYTQRSDIGPEVLLGWLPENIRPQVLDILRKNLTE